MFLRWERGGLEEIALSDTNEEEEGEEDGDDEPDIGYITHKEYEAYIVKDEYRRLTVMFTSMVGGVNTLNGGNHDREYRRV